MAAEGCSWRPSAKRSSMRRSCTMLSNTPAFSQRWVWSSTTCHGGKSFGIIRQGAPARMIQRSPLKTSRNGYSRWGASSVIKVKYGAANAHLSSFISLGYVFRAMLSF